MASRYTGLDVDGLPSLILGCAQYQLHVRKIWQILRVHGKRFKTSERKTELLRKLVELENELGGGDRQSIRSWLNSHTPSYSVFLESHRGRVGNSDDDSVQEQYDRNGDDQGDRVTEVEDEENYETAPESMTEADSEIECNVCTISFTVEYFPAKITDTCRHEPRVCSACITASINIQIIEKAWDQIACPECPELLSFAAVKTFASQAEFERYDRKSVMSVFQSMPNFTMCLGPNCEDGQIHGGGNDQPIMTCTTCGFKTCFTHKMPWHHEQTCQQYDEERRERAEQEAASESLIVKTTKVCPNCTAHIEKTVGCDHMICQQCQHNFCWLCFVSYTNIRNEGNSAHKKSCRHYRKIEPPPNYMREFVAPMLDIHQQRAEIEREAEARVQIINDIESRARLPRALKISKRTKTRGRDRVEQ